MAALGHSILSANFCKRIVFTDVSSTCGKTVFARNTKNNKMDLEVLIIANYAKDIKYRCDLEDHVPY